MEIRSDNGQALLPQWQAMAEEWGFTNFLSPEDNFRTCLRQGQRWDGRKHPGIYFWLAEDGEAYVGKSKEPQARLRTHWRTHRDLIRACFLPCAEKELAAVEARIISRAGGHFRLRNVKLALSTAKHVPFDALISEEEREQFLQGGELFDRPWRTFEVLERLQKKKFERFLATEGGRDALRALQVFVRRAIPKPAATEVGFWSVTIDPANCFIRVNAGQQEVFTVEGITKGRAARVLSAERQGLLWSARTRYVTESYDTAVRPSSLNSWLSDERLLSCRRLVVRLMRHTTALNSGSHCPFAVRLI
jgi:hypothetical protein